MLACGTNWFLVFGCCIRLHTWFAARIGFFLAVFFCVLGKLKNACKCVQKTGFLFKETGFLCQCVQFWLIFFLLMLASAVFSVVWRQKMVSGNQFCPPALARLCCLISCAPPLKKKGFSKPFLPKHCCCCCLAVVRLKKSFWRQLSVILEQISYLAVNSILFYTAT